MGRYVIAQKQHKLKRAEQGVLRLFMHRQDWLNRHMRTDGGYHGCYSGES